ncbi:MAG TPA: hypothetical protein VFL42_12280, partial [Terriglobales bacterium]|nr:hypothetical protein [Terriglobales bacterium]
MLLLSAGFAKSNLPEQPAPLAAAADLVQQLLSRAGSPSSLSVSFQNISVLPTDLQESVQNAIFTGFRNAGVRLVQPEMTQTQVEVTFTEDFRGYLWVATIQQGANRKIVMKQVPRAERLISSRAPQLTLRKTPVWQQDSPLLDFHLDHQNLALLEPSQISIYVNDNGQWRPRYTLAITHAQPWP